MPHYDYDIFGFCVTCSKQLISIENIGGKQQFKRLPDWAEEEVVLNDNSHMRICVCRQCKSYVPDNLENIMTKVYKGWEHFINERGWPDDKKQAYLNRYASIQIVEVA